MFCVLAGVTIAQHSRLQHHNLRHSQLRLDAHFHDTSLLHSRPQRIARENSPVLLLGTSNHASHTQTLLPNGQGAIHDAALLCQPYETSCGGISAFRSHRWHGEFDSFFFSFYMFYQAAFPSHVTDKFSPVLSCHLVFTPAIASSDTTLNSGCNDRTPLHI